MLTNLMLFATDHVAMGTCKLLHAPPPGHSRVVSPGSICLWSFSLICRNKHKPTVLRTFLLHIIKKCLTSFKVILILSTSVLTLRLKQRQKTMRRNFRATDRKRWRSEGPHRNVPDKFKLLFCPVKFCFELINSLKHKCTLLFLKQFLKNASFILS